MKPNKSKVLKATTVSTTNKPIVKMSRSIKSANKFTVVAIMPMVITPTPAVTAYKFSCIEFLCSPWSGCDNNFDSNRDDICAPRLLKKKSIRRVNIRDTIVLPINKPAAIKPKIDAWVCNDWLSRFKALKIVNILFPGSLEATPFTASAPKIPTAATPARSSKPNPI